MILAQNGPEHNKIPVTVPLSIPGVIVWSYNRASDLSQGLLAIVARWSLWGGRGML